MDEKVLEKLKILAESAKYDVSCASSGTSRSHKSGAIGSAAGWGICHSFAEDGRCISLLNKQYRHGTYPETARKDERRHETG